MMGRSQVIPYMKVWGGEGRGGERGPSHNELSKAKAGRLTKARPNGIASYRVRNYVES